MKKYFDNTIISPIDISVPNIDASTMSFDINSHVKMSEEDYILLGDADTKQDAKDITYKVKHHIPLQWDIEDNPTFYQVMDNYGNESYVYVHSTIKLKTSNLSVVLDYKNYKPMKTYDGKIIIAPLSNWGKKKKAVEVKGKRMIITSAEVEDFNENTNILTLLVKTFELTTLRQLRKNDCEKEKTL